MSELIVRPVFGEAILQYLDALAELRIRVFREWPYRYEGSAEYERRYLRHYAVSAGSICVLAEDAGRMVGASTGLPLAQADEAFRKPFVGTDYAVDEVYYFGESVLLPGFRGRGSGRAFFELREAQARNVGARYAAFCAIDREPDHPQRPLDYQALDAFWNRLGYRRQDGIQAHLSWQEPEQSTESEHSLTFWLKPL